MQQERTLQHQAEVAGLKHASAAELEALGQMLQATQEAERQMQCMLSMRMMRGILRRWMLASMGCCVGYWKMGALISVEVAAARRELLCRRCQFSAETAQEPPV